MYTITKYAIHFWLNYAQWISNQIKLNKEKGKMKCKINRSSFANYTSEQNIDAMQCKFLWFRVRPMHNDGLRVAAPFSRKCWYSIWFSHGIQTRPIVSIAHDQEGGKKMGREKWINWWKRRQTTTSLSVIKSEDRGRWTCKETVEMKAMYGHS